METIKASLDRVEGNYAILYSDRDRRKFDIPREMLPSESKPGDRLILELNGDVVVKILVDKKGTEDAKERIKQKYEKLRSRKYLKKSDS